MIRILHAADLHLDSPFRALGPEKARQRRQEQRELLAKITDLAREQRADIVVFAGDLFDAEDVFSDTGKMLESALSSLDMPVFIAPGNHDWYGARSAWAKMSFGRNVHVFTGEEIACFELPELGARVWGSAFTQRSRRPPLTGFEAEKDGDTVDIMVLHGEVGNPGSVYGPITEAELAASGMDYVALGHVHSCSGLRRAGETCYAWPGCPEGRGFDETGEKGVILAEVSTQGCELTFLPLGGRRYEVLTVDITDFQDPVTAVLDALPGDTSRDIYRIRLTGETDAAPALGVLENALRERFFSLELRDETRLRRNIWAQAGSDSLQGLFLQRLRSAYETAADETERERITQAARWGLLAMENGEELPL